MKLFIYLFIFEQNSSILLLHPRDMCHLGPMFVTWTQFLPHGYKGDIVTLQFMTVQKKLPKNQNHGREKNYA
jgi:hypothetical protein